MPPRPPHLIDGIVAVPLNDVPVSNSSKTVRSSVSGNDTGFDVVQLVGSLIPRMPTEVMPMLASAGTLTFTQPSWPPQFEVATDLSVPEDVPTCVNDVPTVVGIPRIEIDALKGGTKTV